MSEDDVIPFHVREEITEYQGPFAGIPDHLVASVQDWVRPMFLRIRNMSRGYEYRFSFDLLREAERRLTLDSGIGSNMQPKVASGRLDDLLKSRRDVLLSMLDFLLWKGVPDGEWQQELADILYQGGSIYQVAPTDRRPGLERRVEQSVENVAQQALARGDSASELLSSAWSATFGLDPNPSHGYRNAVRAVEAVAVPLVVPNDPQGTLGKVVSHLDQARDQWEFALQTRRDGDPSVQTVIDCMGTLWTSHYDRHVTNGVPLHIGAREAEAALPLAATLVHWLQQGFLKKS